MGGLAAEPMHGAVGGMGCRWSESIAAVWRCDQNLIYRKQS